MIALVYPKSHQRRSWSHSIRVVPLVRGLVKRCNRWPHRSRFATTTLSSSRPDTLAGSHGCCKTLCKLISDPLRGTNKSRRLPCDCPRQPRAALPASLLFCAWRRHSVSRPTPSQQLKKLSTLDTPAANLRAKNVHAKGGGWYCRAACRHDMLAAALALLARCSLLPRSDAGSIMAAAEAYACRTAAGGHAAPPRMVCNKAARDCVICEGSSWSSTCCC